MIFKTIFHLSILWQILQNNTNVSHCGINYMMLSGHMSVKSISFSFLILGISPSIEILDAYWKEKLIAQTYNQKIEFNSTLP